MAAPVKITRPRARNIVQRRRLFRVLDKTSVKPITWVAAPAGSGKTTLVGSYLDARKLPCLWYQCDEGDSDLPTFFYYMGVAAGRAAPRYKKPLPVLTPEYLAGVPKFTRWYFESLFSRVSTRWASRATERGFFIVLDNYQEVPTDSPFHDMIANGLDLTPEGVHFVIMSRNEPPSALARLQANDKLGLLGYEQIRFGFEESKELARRRIPNLDYKCIRAMHEIAEGWVAGIVLMLERTRLEGTGVHSTLDLAYEGVFDYFAGEIFGKTEKAVQDFLLRTAFLPMLSVPLIEKMAGAADAGRILSALNRRHYFTERLSGGGQGYRYHPLFRDFLLDRVKTRSAADELAAMRGEAALLLEQSGQIEEAARLYGDARDGQALARMVTHHAREILMQGRNKTVEEWIAGIPGQIADADPWLQYWTGMCSYPSCMPRARKHLERALESFKALDDRSGVYLSWAAIVDTYIFGLDEWNRLDDCIAIFDDLRTLYPSFPSKEVDLIASSRMLMSLTLRKTDQPRRVERWLERVSTLLQEHPSVDIQMESVFSMSVYFLWKGEYDKNAVLLERAEAEIRHHEPAPFAVIRIKLMKGIHYWVTAQYDSALKALSEGLSISEKSGVHVFDSLLWSFRAAAEMAPGRLDLAGKSLGNQMASLLDMSKTLDVYFYHVNAAWYALLSGNASLAAENVEAIAPAVAKLGTPYYKALWNIGAAQVAFLQDRHEEAKALAHAAHRIGVAMKSLVLEWYSLMISAFFHLKEGAQREGLASLRRGLALGRRHGYVHLEFYQPSVMQFLYAEALEEGIEVEYVKGLIRKLGLTQPVRRDPAISASDLEEWPYPIKIYTLGRFEIIRNDQPIRFSGKVQQRPLDLLKALIAFGGTDVPEERLIDALWPDADGDLAHKSFEMTLSRLRRLLGGETFIEHSARQLSLNPLYGWVDCLALERLFETIQESPADQSAPLCEKVVTLYKGHFLPSDTHREWVVSRRETLKIRLLRILITAGRSLEQAGRWEEAAERYAKGIETDSLAEEFHQRLMLCYLRLDRRAEAVRAYKRCSSLLQSELGIEPSAETDAIYSLTLQKQAARV